jgi:heme/copper-type cytochrome/quinol oxidase subunit 4
MIVVLNIGRVFLVLWTLSGFAHVLSPKITYGSSEVVMGLVQIVVSVIIFMFLTRAVKRRKAAYAMASSPATIDSEKTEA